MLDGTRVVAGSCAAAARPGVPRRCHVRARWAVGWLLVTALVASMLALADEHAAASTGSAPGTIATIAGTGASGGSWDTSSLHAKNRTKGRRRAVARSRTVPPSSGNRDSSASRMHRCVTAPAGSGATSSTTSPPTPASVRRCAGRTTRTRRALGETSVTGASRKGLHLD